MKLCHLHGRASKQEVSVPASLTVVLCRGSVQVALSLGECCPVHPCVCHTRVLAGECRGRAPLAVCQPQCVCMLCSWQELRRDPVAGHPCVLTCPLRGSLPQGTLSWWGRRGLHNLCARLPCFLLALQRAGLSLCRKSPKSGSSFGISLPLLVHG